MKKIITSMRILAVVIFICLASLSVIGQGEAERAKKISEQNAEVVRNFEPKLLLENFLTLTKIPRCSNDEAAVADIIFDLATSNGLVVVKDMSNNLVVYLPATAGFESLPSICLQAHMDMVCDKNPGVESIFPIKLIRNGDELSANGTTLGGDDGLGVAALMSLISGKSGIKHGPLELVLTTREEVGLEGVKAFNCSLLHSKKMFNLDFEKEGVLTIGCAGGGVMRLIMKTPMNDVAGIFYPYKISLSGLTGGHSEVDIDRGRGNAIMILTRLLLDLQKYQMSICSFSGGVQDENGNPVVNSIPRNAQAIILVPAATNQAFLVAVKKAGQKISALYPLEKPLLNIELDDSEITKEIIREPFQKKLLQLFATLPNGVMRMEPMNRTLVRTSNNVGYVRMKSDTVIIMMLCRSSLNLQIDSVIHAVALACKTAGAKEETVAKIVPWEPKETVLLKQSVSVYQKLFLKKPEIKTVHAGLEAGVFSEHMPGVQVISFGPTVENAHTPKELVRIESVNRFWKFLVGLIGNK